MNQDLNIAEVLTQILEKLLSLKIEGNFDQVKYYLTKGNEL